MKVFKWVSATLIPYVILSASAAQPPKPNIVHIMVDDLGSQDIASHRLNGEPMYETPHLDRMTKIGRWFTQAYSPAPSCAPSRVAFLRGQHPVNTGVYHVSGGRIPRPWHPDSKRICPYYRYGLPQEEPMIPDALKRAGYVSGHVGKWHAGGKSAGYPFPLDQGFDFGFTERNGRQKYYNDSDLWNPQDGSKNQFFGSWGRMKDRLSDFATHDPADPYQLNEEERPFDKPHDLALGFIRKNKDKPFFLNYCPYYVHGPIQTRDRVRFEHYLKKMGHPFPTDPGPIYDKIDGHMNPYYASMVDTVDWMIGDIITYLEETDDPRNPGHKLIDNTYVIVDSDNGGVIPYTDNKPLKGGKQNTWEGGVRIPFLVLGPGVKPGSTCETPINLIDLFPTFMSMAGVEADKSLNLDGCDILPLIQGTSDKAVLPDGSVRDSLFWFFPWDAHMSAAIRKGEWKLVRHYGAYLGANTKADVQLFRLYADGNRANDLSEAQDIGDQYPEVRKALLAELDEKVAVSGVPVPYRNSTASSVDQKLLSTMPKVLKSGSEEDRVWAVFETGTGKAEMVEAQLLYTLNPKLFDSTNGSREEWFAAPAQLGRGRVEATMPPGATHAVFCMADANGFLITSETMPAVQAVGHRYRDSDILKDGFAYKPGLSALMKLGRKAAASAGKAGADTAELEAALSVAEKQYAAEPIQEKEMCDAIRSLRAAIRNLRGTPEAKHPLINRFPTEPLF
jgi:arylsulfatase A-like enzyme